MKQGSSKDELVLKVLDGVITPEEILNRLSCWYAIEVFHANEDVKRYHFIGCMEEYENVYVILRAVNKMAGCILRLEIKPLWKQNIRRMLTHSPFFAMRAVVSLSCDTEVQYSQDKLIVPGGGLVVMNWR